MVNELNSNPKDVELEALITSQIRDMGNHIHVQAKDGVVHISGTANEFGSKREITTRVQGIGGVHKVINNIRVAWTTDGELHNYT